MSMFLGLKGVSTTVSVVAKAPVGAIGKAGAATKGVAVANSSFAPLTLTGGAGDDQLFGNMGGDTFRVSGGWDRMDGGFGSDTVDYSAARGPVFVWLPDAPKASLPTGFPTMPKLPNWGAPQPPPGPGPGQAEVLSGNGPRVTQVVNHDTGDYGWRLNGKRDELISIENAIGGDFADTLLGGDVDNRLVGGKGGDYLGDDAGRDTLLGGAGADTLVGGRGADLLEGGTEDDRLDGGREADRLDGGAGNDLLSDHALWGGNGADPWTARLFDGMTSAAVDSDTLIGGAGADTLVSGGGGDQVSGGEGTDLLVMNFRFDGAAVAFDAAAKGSWVVRLGGTVTATVDTVEQVSVEGGRGADAMSAAGLGGRATLIGGAGRDTLTGGSQADMLSGGADADVIRGGGGADRIEGGLGRDTLTGGTGGDIFIWNTAAEGGDRVLDFTTRSDILQVDASAFGGGLQAGGLAAGQLAFGTAATAATGQFVYHQATGRLGWDADGVGAGGMQEIATFNPGTVLSHTDFLIVA